MAISVLTNITSLSAQRNLGKTQEYLSGNIAKLSSGQRINAAGDDAAGLAISEKLRAEIRSANQAMRNASDGVSLIQVAEGALNEIGGVLIRMRELAIQSANGVLDSQERVFLNTEFQNLRGEFDRISSVTEFNGRGLLNGSTSSARPVVLQVGIRGSTNDRINIELVTINTQGITLEVNTQSASLTSLTEIDQGLQGISTLRALQNRLQSTISNLSVASENLSAANSRIRDVDIAEETARLARNQILSQAGTSMLAQANQLPQVVLSLLR